LRESLQIPGKSIVLDPPWKGYRPFFSFQSSGEVVPQNLSGIAAFDDNFRTVVTLSLSGLAVSLLVIGKVGFIDPEYMISLLSSF
jgi:hypothetical protein